MRRETLFARGDSKGGADPGGVVTSFLGAGLHVTRRRTSNRKRKRAYPGFRIRMMSFYVDEIRAAAQCVGWGLSHFLYRALLNARNEVAKELGMTPKAMVELSKHDRRTIAYKYHLVASALALNHKRN